jgi:hypothetical protein
VDSNGLPAPEDVSHFDSQFATIAGLAMLHNIDPNGQIALSTPEGGWADQGDSFFFTGLTLAAFDCAPGTPLLAVILKGIYDNGGMIPSHNPLLPNFTVTSRDQVTGVMLGLVERWRRCPADRPAIADAWRAHIAYVAANGGNLGPTADADMLSLRWLWGQVGQYFGVGGAGGSEDSFEVSLVATAASINAAHSACYPVHTGTLQAIIAAKIHQPIAGKGAFCDATRGLGLPLTEWMCGRATGQSWLKQFEPDVWIDQNQRCPNWEGKPDAGGNMTPGVDFFEVYRLAAEGNS